MYFLFDIGATKIRFGISKDLKSFSDPIILETPLDFAGGLNVFKKIYSRFSKTETFKGVAGGAPGPLNRERSMMINAPNLVLWNKKPLKNELEKIFKTSVFIENDSAVVGLGEAIYGAGKGFEIMGYITVSTGVGGARIVNGKIDSHVIEFEPGHQVVDIDGSILNIKEPIYLENLISGRAFKNRFNKEPYEIKDADIWNEAAKWLAFGINNTIMHWSPDAMVIGGSMMKEVGISLDKVQEYLKGILKIFPEIPVLKKAELGDLGGLYGALEFLKQNLDN